MLLLELLPVYQARVEAEFPDEHVTGLIRRSWLDRAVAMWEEGELEGEYRRSPYVFAIDSAHTGPDSSCLLQLQGGIVREIETWRGADLMETTGRVAKAAKDLLRDQYERHRSHVRWRDRFSENDWPRKIVVDVVGLGLGVYSRLKEQGHPALDFNGGKKAFLMASRMANRRAEAYWRVREALQAEELALPPDKKLMEELLAQEWSVTSSGKTILEPKEEIAQRRGRSPDRGDALSMAVWAQRSFNITRPTGPPLVKTW